MLKKIIYLSIICFIIGCGVCWAQQPAAEPVEPLNRIVAVVNDEIITENDLDEAIDQFKQQLTAANIAVPPPKTLRHDALDQLINYRLQLQMAERNGISPTPAEVDQAIAQIAQTHHLTVDQLQAQFAEQHVSFDDFRKKIAGQLKITKLQQQMIGGQVKVTDADIAAFKKALPVTHEYKLVDFFLPVSEEPGSEELDHALTAAHDIRQQLTSGADIDKITPAYQDLGWRTKSDLPQIFVEQLPSLMANKVSQPLRAPNGYHVLKLVETRDISEPLTDEQVRTLVLRQKYEEAVKTAVEKARKEAYVQIIP